MRTVGRFPVDAKGEKNKRRVPQGEIPSICNSVPLMNYGPEWSIVGLLYDSSVHTSRSASAHRVTALSMYSTR